MTMTLGVSAINATHTAEREWKPGEIGWLEGKLPVRVIGPGARPGVLRVTVSDHLLPVPIVPALLHAEPNEDGVNER